MNRTLHRVIAALTLAAPLTLLGCAVRLPALSPELDPGNLALPDHQIHRNQAGITHLQIWNDQPVITTSAGQFSLNTDLHLIPVTPPAGSELIDLLKTKTASWALVRSSNALRLCKFQRGYWVLDQSFPSPGDTLARLVQDGINAAVVTPDTLYRRLDHAWTQIPLPRLLDERRITLNSAAGAFQNWELILYQDRLVAGGNYGEWGGELHMLDLRAKDFQWKPLSPDNDAPAQARTDDGVTGMIADKDGRLWISMGSVQTDSASLVLFDGFSRHKILLQVTPPRTKPSVFGRHSALTAICTDTDGHALYLLAPEAGIFCFENDKLTPIIQFPREMRLTYAGSMVMDHLGNLYVSNDDGGLLVFRRGNASYQFDYVQVPKAKYDLPSSQTK